MSKLYFGGSMGHSSDKYRIQLDFTPEAFRELESLKTDVQASSRADTVRYAMRVLRWIVNERRRGAIIFESENGALSEIKFPFLPGPTGAEEDRNRDMEKARRARRQEEWSKRGREVLNQQEEQFKSAYDAGRQAYRSATHEESNEG